MSPARRAAVVDDELRWVGDTRASPLNARPSARRDRPALRPNRACRGHALAHRIRILQDAAGARHRQRRGTLADTPATLAPPRATAPGVPRPTRKSADSNYFPGPVQPAVVVGEFHGRPGTSWISARPCGDRTHLDEIADVSPLEMRVAVDGAADGPRRAGPGLQPGESVGDGPAHEPVDRDACIGAHRVRRPRFPPRRRDPGSPAR